MRRNAGQGIQRLLDRLRIQFDRGRVRVFHAAAPGTSREVIKESVGVERTVIHPGGGRSDNLVQSGDDLRHVVVRGIGIDDHAEVTAGLVEAGFLEISDLNGRVDQAVIVGGVQLFDRGRCQGRGNAPSGRNVAEVDVQRRRSSVDGIHQELRKIQKGVMRV